MKKRKGKKSVRVAQTYDSDDERAYAREDVPDPNDSDFYDDEIDQLHKQRDKILLDKGVKYQAELPANQEEEVLAYDEMDSDEEDQQIAEMERQLKMLKRAGFKEKLASDLEDSSEEEEEEEKTSWGGKKKRYYGGNLRDYDDVESGGSDTEAAIMEERAARAMQKKRTEEMIEADYGLDELMQEAPAEEEADPMANRSESETIVIPKDLSKLSEEQKMELVKKQSPELIPLMEDHNKKLIEYRDKWMPIHQLIVDGKLPESGGSQFVRAKVRLILGYCLRVRFYVMVKNAGESLHRHPVIERISQYREGLRELAKEDAAYERQVQYILKKIKKGEEIRIKGSAPSLTNGKRKREEDGEEEKKKKHKNDYAMEHVEEEEEEEAEEEEEEEAAEEEEEGEEGGKRAITYQMEKNKGLTPKRKKEQRNPRVKHRAKFRKANIRRRGAVREVRTETHRYGGELSGIRTGVKRSVKLK